jgi:1,4-dihydroxy-2-naphthoyl-CoA hydrolase
MANSTGPNDDVSAQPGQGFGIAPQGFMQLIDLRFVSVSESEIVAELPVSDKHYQPMGIVHGGVYCSMVETVCSVGGHVHASKNDMTVVGVDNQTSFLKATRSGTLRATARPLAVGRRTQLWEANIHDEKGTLLSTGRVRLICLPLEQNLAGKAAGAQAEKT